MEARLIASVVLPTHGRRSSLLRVLRTLNQQSVDPQTFEVVVICDGDIDGSAAACQELVSDVSYRLRVCEQPNQGPAAARNRGVAEAAGALIVFLDDDVVPDCHLIARHVEAHEGQELRVTIGPLLAPRDTRLNIWADWEELMLSKQYSAMSQGRWKPTYRQFYTGNAAVLKRHILAVGSFDVTFRRAEDVELALRLHEHGLHFVFLPDARGWHYISRSLESWLRTPAAYGRADIAMARAGRPRLLDHVAEEYRYRSRSVRLISYLCVGRPAASRIAFMILAVIIRVSHRYNLRFVGRTSCTLLFNLSYYDAFAMSLGDRQAFMQMLQDGRAALT